MSVTTTIALSPQAQKILARAEAAPAAMLPAMRKALNYELGLAVGHIQKRRLTGKGPFPASEGRLGVRTNRLRSSVWQAPARIDGTTITASIGSNVKYAGVHEYGFNGTVKVKEHKRRIIANDRYKQTKNGRFVKTQSGIRGRIRAHAMRMNMPARAPFRRGIEDRIPNLSRALSAAIIDTYRT